MNNFNQIMMISFLNNINQANLNNGRTVNSNSNQNEELFNSILNNSLSKSLGSSSSCSCNNGISQLSTLTTMIEVLNNIKISNQSTENIASGTMDNSISTNNSIINNKVESSTSMDKALELLNEQLGKPYVWGANGPDLFDCSGLTRYIYKEALGKDIPRVSYDQSKFGQSVDKKDLQPGDLVFFDTMNKGRVSHVGIYIGDGEFIHASNKRDGVKKSSLSSSYYQKTYKGARRP